jgi:hypothetical protein
LFIVKDVNQFGVLYKQDHSLSNNKISKKNIHYRMTILGNRLMVKDPGIDQPLIPMELMSRFTSERKQREKELTAP